MAADPLPTLVTMGISHYAEKARWALQRYGIPFSEEGEQIAQMVQRYDRQLGPAVRVWAYSHLLYTPAIADAMVAPPVPAYERWLLRCGGWWVLRRLMVKGMGITPAGGEKALARIRACFDEAAALLADGRPFLAGATFTAADLTFATLAAPALGQPYGTAPGLDDNTPPAMAAQLAAFREHPAGQHALRMWAEQRGVVLWPAGGGSKL